MSTISSSTETASPAEASSSNACDLNNLIYRFDAENPWVYFADGAPIASSVERGRKRRNPKLRKIYVPKRNKITARKNRPHREIQRMSLICSCEKGCLLRRNPHGECREFIRQLRQDFYQKSYHEQNYILLRQMDVRICPTGIRRVTYNIPSLGTVCKGAFMKCYGFSHSKIAVLLKKVDNDGFSVQQDMRGRHGNNAMKLLPEARRAVINFITSHHATESHYRRSRTHHIKYFDSSMTMKEMWRDFVSKNPGFKTNRSKLQNKGPVISFSTFRNIFNENLRDLLSFRKAREDTCQYCDEIRNKIKCILSAQKEHGGVTNTSELQQLREKLQQHRRESEIRFASLKYDVNILSKRQ